MEKLQEYIAAQHDVLERVDTMLEVDVTQLMWLSSGLRNNTRTHTGQIREDLLNILVDLPRGVEEMEQGTWRSQWKEMNALLTKRREELAVVIHGIEKQDEKQDKK
ncbi:uncharacterized protein DNG_01772 [Cephalotrichum gorgonifer]|uniref:Uncharacterized protein n=1 Tax=Cephalotrichum gorgonifer TaxID=2041049 RepID=A0AAE8MR70_9PEZI|nr:uncharacterized protein DNG_01772 [Cephalotrichum gorgonifer]